MAQEQRKVAVVTSLGRKYSGLIDIPNAALRTTDLFNSPNRFWRNQNDKSFNDAILIYNASMTLDETVVYRKFEKIQLKLGEVFYFYDDFQSISDATEKKKSKIVMQKTQKKLQRVNIITRVIATSFYDIQGIFYGLFRNKSNDKFIPLTDVQITRIYTKEGKWFKKELVLPHNFICISASHIESVAIS
jgi:hypothetical protein